MIKSRSQSYLLATVSSASLRGSDLARRADIAQVLGNIRKPVTEPDADTKLLFAQRRPFMVGPQADLSAQPAPSLLSSLRAQMVWPRTVGGLLAGLRGQTKAADLEAQLASLPAGESFAKAQAQGAYASLKHGAVAWLPLVNRYAAVTLGLEAAQWWVRGLSNRANLELAGSAATSTPQHYAHQLAHFGAHLLLAEVLRAGADSAQVLWERQAHLSVIERAQRAGQNDVRSWSIPDAREALSAAVSQQAPRALEDAARVVRATSSNVMGLFVFHSTLERGVLPLDVATLAGPMLSLMVLQWAAPWQRRLAAKENAAGQAFHAATVALPDNVLLGNSYNEAAWQNKVLTSYRQRQDASYFRLGFKIVTEALIAGLTSGSTLLRYVGLLARQPQSGSTAGQLAQALPTFHAMNNVRQQAAALTQNVTTLDQVAANLGSLQQTIEAKPRDQLQSRLLQMISHRADFRIQGPNGPVSLLDFIDNLQALNQPGRWTIRARNGAGKSTLLNLIKSICQDKAFMLPVSHSLEMATKTGSAGEKVLGHMAEAIAHAKANIILFDEWSANLDETNTAKVSAELAKLAKMVCVVEVVHGFEEEPLAGSQAAFGKPLARKTAA